MRSDYDRAGSPTPGVRPRRDAARVGDEIFVTGTVGDATLGWANPRRQGFRSRTIAKILIDRFLRPDCASDRRTTADLINPAPAASISATVYCRTRSCAGRRSGVGAEIEAATLPLSAAYSRGRRDNLEFAAHAVKTSSLFFCLRRVQRSRPLATACVPARRSARSFPVVAPRLVGKTAAANSQRQVSGMGSMRAHGGS